MDLTVFPGSSFKAVSRGERERETTDKEHERNKRCGREAVSRVAEENSLYLVLQLTLTTDQSLENRFVSLHNSRYKG